MCIFKALPILRTPQRGSKLSLPWYIPLPDRTDSGWPLHPCAFLRPVCLPTQTAPYLGFGNAFIHSANHS